MTQYENQDDLEQAHGVRSLPIPVIAAILIGLGIVLLLSVMWILGVFNSQGELASGVSPFVKILNPVAGSSFPVSQPLVIEGTVGGLVEGSLMVQVLDENNKLLVEAPVTVNQQDITAEASSSWNVQVIVMAEPGSRGFVRAFASSIADERVVTEDRIPVIFEFDTVDAYIDLTEPEDGAVVGFDQPILVTGMAAGLFEGSLVVQALDQDGGVLDQVPAVIDAPDAGMGGEGAWQVQLEVDVQAGSPGSLRAYASSPKDGSLLVEDIVHVTFGEAGTEILAFIEINEPQDGAVLDANTPLVVRGTGAGLFEGNVVVEALDAAGDVLSVESAVIQSPDAGIGGEGPWSLILVVPAEPGSMGTLHAYSPSPVDGSLMAEDSVGVTYGQVEIPEAKPPLEATAWQLVSLGNQPVMEGSLVWAKFEQGTVSGSAGCNDYFSSFGVDGVGLNIEPVAVTRRACTQPSGLMDQESAYTSLLESTASYTVEGSQLFLADGTGEIILVYTASVVGSVNAAEGSPIPEGAVVTIRLEDVSRADAQAETIAEIRLTGIASFPFPFALPYDLERINPQMSCAVRVQVHDASGALLYTNTSAYPVLTRGSPLNVDVLVESVQ